MKIPEKISEIFFRGEAFELEGSWSKQQHVVGKNTYLQVFTEAAEFGVDDTYTSIKGRELSLLGRIARWITKCRGKDENTKKVMDFAISRLGNVTSHDNVGVIGLLAIRDTRDIKESEILDKIFEQIDLGLNISGTFEDRKKNTERSLNGLVALEKIICSRKDEESYSKGNKKLLECLDTNNRELTDQAIKSLQAVSNKLSE
ncbi:MAG: hypothetical protein HN831_02235 [Waddliaceae bacterium]|jgi:hypothetical protein|nr:hypothetical protein [Waddliaceae bacterium]MBT7264281.1 hypothetical protein [Waddliaceae bacterium]